ncbi:rnd [Symbiodinium sp. KB8]|nr:rnd [Symbiodinium sp. KB8]
MNEIDLSNHIYITSQNSLEEYCQKVKQSSYICLDTEFIRENTYYPILCLIQCLDEKGNLAIIDPLPENLDLDPFKDILFDLNITKVFHACRQDIEIFYNIFGKVPTPLFDTQVSAMVCGYGDCAGYETLVRTMLKRRLDKSSRFSDWSQRPLNKKQIKYALADVIHLKDIYEKLLKDAKKRCSWIKEEMDLLTNDLTYKVDIDSAWQRIKVRQPAPDQFMYVVQKIAKWREEQAINENIPRQFIIRDDVIAKLATVDLNQIDYVNHINVSHRVKTAFIPFAKQIIKESYEPKIKVIRPKTPKQLKFSKDCLEMMKLLLKIKATKHRVAERLIASSDTLKKLCAGKKDISVLQGWRKEVFGDDAVRMLNNQVGLQLNRRKIEVVDIEK